MAEDGEEGSTEEDELVEDVGELDMRVNDKKMGTQVAIPSSKTSVKFGRGGVGKVS